MNKPLRVLIVDDSEDDAGILLRKLKRGGYDPTFKRVDTPVTMSDALDRQAWDVVVADYSMPHFSSPAALSLLKQKRLDLPFIIVSGTIDDEKAIAAMKAGAHDYFIKGNLARLVPAIEREIHEAEMRRISKRTEELLKAHARQQAAVAELGQHALAGAHLPALMSEAVVRVAQTLEVEYSEILELLPEGHALLLRAGVGWKKGSVGRDMVGAGTESQAGYTLLSKEPVVVEDLRTETRFSGPPLLRDHGVVSGMSVVIQGQNRPFGVFGVHTTRKRIFTQDDVHFLQAVANVLATAIEHQKAEERIRFLAYHDDLTGLPNRTLFQDRLQQAILSAQRAGKTLALLILDLDRFKEVNDNLGHHYGDLLLKQIGPRLRAALRESDTVARLGGDEFAILLPLVDVDGAAHTARKILKRLEFPFLLETLNVAIGASIGIAIFPAHGTDAQTLMRHSDMAMYMAKQTGIGYAVHELELKT